PGWTASLSTGDKRCRRCSTLLHVLNHCRMHSAAVQGGFVKAIPTRGGNISVRVNQRPTLVQYDLRPDIQIVDEGRKRVVLIDLAIPFEDGLDALLRCRLQKVDKYTPLAASLESAGYQTEVHALLVGTLGSWDPANEAALRVAGVHRRFAPLMRKLMTSDVIRRSRDIYIEHNWPWSKKCIFLN
ncbi:PREDICTED: uncharacterized protein LOC108559993, partial [Nicrophorus vespilloides]|uniref:Uncharacterized protein LOC108559993 n=1 Tax=Nicrophorus vespilloides TaxID=110193 RepID=A0ABM1ME88_NICVS